ncbi:MAG: hypothetical protein ACXQS4_03785 [Methermicoccaceae archaeon]
MKITINGASGQPGSDLVEVFENVTDVESLKVLKDLKLDVVVNSWICADAEGFSR